MKKSLLGTVVLSMGLLCAAPLWAAPVTPPKPAKNVETRITSDQLTYLAEKQLVIFDKNVHVTRPDFEIWADRITVYLKPPKDNGQKQGGEKGGMPAGMAAGDVDRIGDDLPQGGDEAVRADEHKRRRKAHAERVLQGGRHGQRRTQPEHEAKGRVVLEDAVPEGETDFHDGG